MKACHGSNFQGGLWPCGAHTLKSSNERVLLVDHWDDGTATWQPRVVQKLLWYSKMPNTVGNRHLAYDWLMLNCARFD